MRAFAGCHAPRAASPLHDGERLAAALADEGPATGATRGALALAWTPEEPLADGVVCLVDGRPRTEALGLAPATPAADAIRAGWARHGEGVLERIGGEFALLLWDGERGLVARDRLGARPLFVTGLGGGAVAFASEVRVLLAALPSTPAPDPVAATQWLARTRSGGARTLYAGIERLPPGHALLLDGDGARRVRWWQPRYAAPRERTPAEVRTAIAAAVERSLEDAASPAVMLSGGLDSATVAALAPEPLPAYSAVFPDDPAVDESDRIARVRDRLGSDGVEARFTGGSALGAALEFQREWRLPSVSPNLLVWTPLLRRAAADGADVVLDGEGGDELFGCARYLVADRLRSGRARDAARIARQLPGMGDEPRTRWVARALLAYGARGALPPRIHEALRRARGAGAAGPAWLAPEAERIHRATDRPWAWKELDGPRWWAELAHTLTADALGAADQLRREGRLAGVELRHPLRDPELVELALSLAPELGFDPHLDRPVVRRALAADLPPETLACDGKPAFNSVLAAALAGRDRAALERLLADPHPELARRVRGAAVRALAEDPSGARRHALDLWRIATLELWLRGLDGSEPDGLEPDDNVTFARSRGLVRQPGQASQIG